MRIASVGWKLVRGLPFVPKLWGLHLKRKAASRKRALQRCWPDVIRAVEAATEGLCCYPEYGTLLGLMREGGVIAHDDDMDFGVTGASAQEIWKRIRPLGFRLVHAFEYHGAITEIATCFRGVTVDFFFVGTSDGKPVMYVWDWIPDNGGRWPGRRFFPPSVQALERRHIGPVDVRIPANWERLLGFEYGPTWRTPDPGWNKEVSGERLADRAEVRYDV